MKNNWETAYENNDFKIITLEPSFILKKYHEDVLNHNNNVLDVGCGNGRNAIFLASLGHHVDCFDIADIKWVDALDTNIKNNISFTKSDIAEYPWGDNQYKLILASRVIQYLSIKELLYFFEKVSDSLQKDGSFLLSYTVNGGIFSQKGINVSKYSHPISLVEQLLSQYFNKIIISKGLSMSTSVNYDGEVSSYDIYASAKK